MKRLITLAILFFMASMVFCQLARKNNVFDDDQHFFQPRKFDYGLTVGTQFTSVSGFGSALNNYVAPHFSYSINNRFSIGGGFSIIRTNYFKARSFFLDENTTLSNGNFTSATIFVEGKYLVNKRLTIYGSAWKQLPISQDPLPYNPFNPVSSKGAQGINFNVGYKVGDHMYIQAGFRYSDGINPLYNDPFSRNPFINDAYGTQTSFGMPRW